MTEETMSLLRVLQAQAQGAAQAAGDHGAESSGPMPLDELHGSDVIIPSENITFEEAQKLFQGEGLVPD